MVHCFTSFSSWQLGAAAFQQVAKQDVTVRCMQRKLLETEGHRTWDWRSFNILFKVMPLSALTPLNMFLLIVSPPPKNTIGWSLNFNNTQTCCDRVKTVCEEPLKCSVFKIFWQIIVIAHIYEVQCDTHMHTDACIKHRLNKTNYISATWSIYSFVMRRLKIYFQRIWGTYVLAMFITYVPSD